jgi:hypothetical protein
MQNARLSILRHGVYISTTLIFVVYVFEPRAIFVVDVDHAMCR